MVSQVYSIIIIGHFTQKIRLAWLDLGLPSFSEGV